MIVLGIETSTPQTTVAVGTETGILAAALLSSGRSSHEQVVPEIDHLLRWAEVPITSLAGIAVGLGPGLFTSMRVGIATAKTLAQSLSVPIAGLASLDVVAFSVRYCRRLICAVVDAKRKEVFYAFYRPVPGGVTRQSEFEVGSPDRLMGELEATTEDILLVGNGALVYRRQLEEAGSHVEFASPAYSFPAATALVELAIPRFQREEFDRVFDVRPYYVRKSDAEIAWDQRRRAG
ncbi:MAG TPA: tRNA (adenosine(37)-N6)-threonylcarbamoyltransferase complex dimerization subunit type 1 TsaB [Actinomycetota bacterium]|nr:tRNA (adenosine(37)-N6)-threonylcarbamoyltransferase complex dimerization subunit type 1 TsaB [Actinomycetota bacterium]